MSGGPYDLRPASAVRYSSVEAMRLGPAARDRHEYSLRGTHRVKMPREERREREREQPESSADERGLDRGGGTGNGKKPTDCGIEEEVKKMKGAERNAFGQAWRSFTEPASIRSTSFSKS